MTLVGLGQAIRGGLRFARKVDEKYNINKIFVEKYVPPGYRKYAKTAIDIAGGAAPLTYIVDYLSNYSAIQNTGQQAAPYQQQKTYNRFPRRYGSRSQNKYRSGKRKCYCGSRRFRSSNRF